MINQQLYVEKGAIQNDLSEVSGDSHFLYIPKRNRTLDLIQQWSKLCGTKGKILIHPK